MTTATASVLTDSQQALIDARLDTIDRMLLGHVARADRITIVSEVEAQIRELLAEKDRSEITREDVVDVLRTLDPPEAYLTDDVNSESLQKQRQLPKLASRSIPPSKLAKKEYGWLGGVIGLSALGVILLFPLAHFLAMAMNSTMMTIASIILTIVLGFIGGTTGLVLSIQDRRQGALPILGIIGGGLSLSLSMLGMSWLAYVLANM